MQTLLPLDLPAYCGVIHLVDDDDEFADTCRLHQHGVLARLASALETRLELASSRRNDLKQTIIDT